MNKIIGTIDQLTEGGKGLRFELTSLVNGERVPAFAVQFDGQYFAYLNRCGHIAVQLDYMPGDFFGDDGQTLICATHGAEYAPDTGACLGGPCFGVGLEALELKLENDQLILDSSEYELAKTNASE